MFPVILILISPFPLQVSVAAVPSEREIEDKAQEGVINGGKGAVREEMHFMGNGKAREELYSTSLLLSSSLLPMLLFYIVDIYHNNSVLFYSSSS